MVEITTGKPHLTLGLHAENHNTEQNNIEYSKNTTYLTCWVQSWNIPPASSTSNVSLGLGNIHHILSMLKRGSQWIKNKGGGEALLGAVLNEDWLYSF